MNISALKETKSFIKMINKNVQITSVSLHHKFKKWISKDRFYVAS